MPAYLCISFLPNILGSMLRRFRLDAYGGWSSSVVLTLDASASEAGDLLMIDGVIEASFSSALTSEDAVELQAAWSDSKCEQVQMVSQFCFRSARGRSIWQTWLLSYQCAETALQRCTCCPK